MIKVIINEIRLIYINNFVCNTLGKDIKCRYDWHQTASHVTVAVYAKKYSDTESYVEINPVRLIVHLYFPGENANFDLDLELAGIVDCTACTANMLGTKLEVKLKKEELSSWE